MVTRVSNVRVNRENSFALTDKWFFSIVEYLSLDLHGGFHYMYLPTIKRPVLFFGCYNGHVHYSFINKRE